YIHRIGRTGRAGNSGTAITFVDWDDVPRWKLINKELSLGIEEPVETYHTSPHLYTDLDIPEDAGGRLPRSMRKRAGLAAEKLEDLGETGGHGRGRGRSPRGQNSRGRSGGGRGKGSRNGRDRRRERDSHQGAGTQRQPRPRRARRRRRKGSED
ncbi:MAG: ATP-dependent helicase, partial [Varibaculum cambriense]|nr:ATP-dependent helicase [Varibaculum cambriense]